MKVFKFSQTYNKKSKILRIPNLCVFSMLCQWLRGYQEFYDSSLNKKLENISGTHAAAWRQTLAAYLS